MEMRGIGLTAFEPSPASHGNDCTSTRRYHRCTFASTQREYREQWRAELGWRGFGQCDLQSWTRIRIYYI
jgi:hypothetical protein